MDVSSQRGKQNITAKQKLKSVFFFFFLYSSCYCSKKKECSFACITEEGEHNCKNIVEELSLTSSIFSPLQKQTASLTHEIEAEMAGRASGGGPLTIMKKLGDKVNEEKQKEKERKAAKAKAKGRA